MPEEGGSAAAVATAPSAAAAVVPRWQCLLAGLPELLLGLQFLAAHWQLRLPGTDPGMFVALLQVEILVIMATVAMGCIGLVAPRNAEQARGRIVLFWTAFTFFLLIALDVGWGVLAGYLAMLLAGNAGMLLGWRTPTAGIQLAVRCVVAFFVFMMSIGVAGTPESMEDWRDSPEIWNAGTTYFFIMATLEMSGFFLRTVPGLGARTRPEHWGEFLELPEVMRDFFRLTGRGSTRLLDVLTRFIRPARRR